MTNNAKQYLVDEQQLVRIEELLNRMEPVDPTADRIHDTIASMLKTIRTRSRDNRLADLEAITDEFDAELTRIKLHLTAAGIPETKRIDEESLQMRYITPAERVAMLAQRLAEAEDVIAKQEAADTNEVPLVEAEPQTEQVPESAEPNEESEPDAVIEVRASKEFSRFVWAAYALIALLISISVAAAMVK